MKRRGNEKGRRPDRALVKNPGYVHSVQHTLPRKGGSLEKMKITREKQTRKRNIT